MAADYKNKDMTAQLDGMALARQRHLKQTEARYHARQIQKMKDMGLRRGRVDQWIEVWDYNGENVFRAFIAGDHDQRTLFTFFDANSVEKDLKTGLMALLELAPELDCARVTACLDRLASDSSNLIRSLGWVGFELTTLDSWTFEQGKKCISDKWLLLSMDA